jgi:tetratricopeptide (TPR) repeat protein
VAVGLVVLVVGGAVGGILYFAQPAAPVAVVQGDPEQDHQRAQEQQRLEEEKRQLEEKRSQLEREKRRFDFERLMAQGDGALKEKRYQDAEKAFGDALKLFPDDGAALKGMVTARSALLALSEQGVEKEKRQAEYQRLMAQGKEAMEGKQYAAAVQAYERALQLVLGDETAEKALAAARAALAADDNDKARLAEYRTHLEAGKTALVAQRYADAVREFIAAQRLIPGDPEAVQGQKQAENQLDALMDREKRQKAFGELAERAQKALRERRWDDAIDSLKAALQLFPADARVQQALREAEQARTQARAEYARLMGLGDQAMQLGRYEEAYRQYTEALKVLPGDTVAQAAQARAQRASQDTAVAQTAYARYLSQGQLAMQANRWADAIIAFQEALRLVPNDVTAAGLLRDARTAALQQTTVQATFPRLLQAGQTALSQGQFADAIRSLTSAQQLAPTNAQLIQALQQARYGQAMADGRKALQQKRYSDAVTAFEAALVQLPGDTAATNGLERAKRLAKQR